MKLKFFIIVFLYLLNSNAQEKQNVDFIDLKFYESSITFSDVEISIYSYRPFKKTFGLKATYCDKFKKEKISLTEKEFDTIVEALYKINISDFLNIILI
ncbi:hypothetical protein ACFS5J_12145 [Flavobacterium chuncheonense]|uniref:Uncharacterized protein n=1 Tax=Flavobacterium chuncheonense TaxID=2026653 RepID=A0ABW5YP20_9FLAO